MEQHTAQAQEKLWLKSYPKGIPADINPDRYSSLLGLFEECVKKFGNKPAYENLGVVLSFNDIDRLSGNFAAFLQQKGMKKGDRIAIQMPNLLQYPIATFGALKAGLTIVNTNPLYTPKEMKHQFDDTGATAIVIVANFAPVR